MRLMPARLLSGLALVAAGAFGVACAPAQEMPVDTSAEDRAAVDTLRGAWETAYEAGDAAALAGLYTTDAVVMNPGQATLAGRAAIEAYYSGVLAQGTVESTITPGATRVGGDIGYEYGTFTGTMTMADGTSNETAGRYVVLLRRDTDGAWRIAGSGGSPDSVEGLQSALDQAMAAAGGGMEGSGS